MNKEPNHDDNSENYELHRKNEELHRELEHLRLQDEERRLENVQRLSTVNRFTQGIYYLGAALEILLVLRFLLHLLAANTENLFASFILELSEPFVIPFANLFNNPQIGGSAVFEITTLVGMAIYALLTWLVVRLIKVIWL